MSNTITITGNCGSEPSLRYLPSGVAVAEFSVAVNRNWSNQKGEKQEETSWFKIVCWKGMAESVAESITSGTRVIVTGRMQEDRWETEDGGKRSAMKLQADEIGPSLRFATAQVTRVSRGTPEDGEQG